MLHSRGVLIFGTVISVCISFTVLSINLMLVGTILLLPTFTSAFFFSSLSISQSTFFFKIYGTVEGGSMTASPEMIAFEEEVTAQDLLLLLSMN